MKNLKVKLAAVGTTAAALTMVAGTAFASPNTVTVWGNTSGTYAVAASAAPVAFSALHGSTVVTMGCTSSAATGSTNTVTAGTGITNVVDLANVTFAGCIGPGSNVNVAKCSTWHLVVDSGATAAANDILVGRVVDVCATVTSTPIASVCSFTVEGEADATYNEATGVLSVNETGYTGDLSITAKSGCGTSLSVGDPTNIGANYTLSAVGGLAFAAGAINAS